MQHRGIWLRAPHHAVPCGRCCLAYACPECAQSSRRCWHFSGAAPGCLGRGRRQRRWGCHGVARTATSQRRRWRFSIPSPGLTGFDSTVLLAPTRMQRRSRALHADRSSGNSHVVSLTSWCACERGTELRYSLKSTSALMPFGPRLLTLSYRLLAALAPDGNVPRKLGSAPERRLCGSMITQFIGCILHGLLICRHSLLGCTFALFALCF